MDIEILVNFAVVMSTLTLTSTLLRLSLTITRYVVLSTIYAIVFALVVIEEGRDWSFILLSIAISLGASYEYGSRASLLYVLTYLALSATLELLSRKLSSMYGQQSTTPLILAMATLTLAIIASLLIRLVSAHVSRQKNTHRIEIIYKEKRVFSLGFYDSGNTAKEDDVPVVILPKELAQAIDFEPTSSTAVMTVAGIKVLRAAPMDIVVYYPDGSHILYAVLGAVSHFAQHSSVLLNAEMRRYL